MDHKQLFTMEVISEASKTDLHPTKGWCQTKGSTKFFQLFLPKSFIKLFNLAWCSPHPKALPSVVDEQADYVSPQKWVWEPERPFSGDSSWGLGFSHFNTSRMLSVVARAYIIH